MTNTEPASANGASSGRLRLDLAELTLGELAEVGGLLDPLALTDVIVGPRQALAIAAIACVVRRRTDPDYSYADALKLRMGEVELVGNVADAGEALGAATGATLPRLLEPGESTPTGS